MEYMLQMEVCTFDLLVPLAQLGIYMLQMEVYTFDLSVPLAQLIRFHAATGSLNLWFVGPSRTINYITCCKWSYEPLFCQSLSLH